MAGKPTHDAIGPRPKSASGNKAGRRKAAAPRGPDADRGGSRTVFLVHGRNSAAKSQLIILLNALRVRVVDWRQARTALNVADPHTLDVFRKGVELGDAVVVLLTADDHAQLRPDLGQERRRLQPRPNVLFELGYLLGGEAKERSVVVQLGRTDLMTDVSGINFVHLDDGPQTRLAFVEELRRVGIEPDTTNSAWLDSSSGGQFQQFIDEIESDSTAARPFAEVEFALHEGEHAEDDGEPPPIDWEAVEDRRGLYTEYAVDSGLSMRLSHRKLFQDIRWSLRNGSPIDLKHHYIGSQMAEYWSDVVRDSGYGHRSLQTKLRSSMAEILAGAELIDQEFDLVSLGPGDGVLDCDLIEAIGSLAHVDFYFPVDISFDLLQTAVLAVQERYKATRETNKMWTGPRRIKAFMADFEDGLAELDFLMRSERPALYTLSGFTLGNAKEDPILDSIRGAMRLNDSLLVDARLHPLSTDRPNSAETTSLMAPYSSKIVHRFAFGPVEIATKYSVSLSDPGVSVLKAVKQPKLSSVDGAINVLLQCEGLYQVRNKAFCLELGWDVETRSGEMSVRRRGNRIVDLALVTFYNYDKLVAWFGAKGFNVVWTAQIDGNSMGLFLLRPLPL